MDELELLKRFKKKSGWSYDRLAKGIGVHYQSVQTWFIGKSQPGNLARRAIRDFLKREDKTNR